MQYILTALFIAIPPASALAQSEGVAFHPKSSVDALCEAVLDHPGASDLAWAFAALWLDRRVPEANERLRGAYQAFLDGAKEMTPALADEKAKWQLRTWVRLYYLFGERSFRFPGRLEAATQECIETLFWNYAGAKSTVERGRLEYVWMIQGSENHDMMDLSNAFLALQAVAELPAYRDRPLPDGHTPAEHVDAWTKYYIRYCEERVKHGLFIEIASPTYGKYLIPELANLFDFVRDATLRAKLEVLLHVTWADWALEQLGGVRGGAKARCYQGNYARHGASDSWRMMGRILLGEEDWANPGVYTHPIMGFGFVLATSRYRLPALVAALARDAPGRGQYAYVSRRPGRMTAPPALPPLGGHPCWYFMDCRDSRLVRYTWCTPGHVMGCFLVDPALKESTTVEAGKPDQAEAHYAAISGQNRWQGIVFATDPDARIFPQCVGRPDKHRPDVSVTEIQHVAVQHENVMLVQANRAEPRNTAMRVYFAPGMRARLVENAGWLFLEEGDSFAAVIPLAAGNGTAACGTSWDSGVFLRVDDTYAPVVFVTGRRARHATFDAFQRYVLKHAHDVRDGVLHYRFRRADGEAIELGLYLDRSRLPEVNGTPIDLAPINVYACPFLTSEFGSGRVTLTSGSQRLTLDVNSGTVTRNAGRVNAGATEQE